MSYNYVSMAIPVFSYFEVDKLFQEDSPVFIVSSVTLLCKSSVQQAKKLAADARKMNITLRFLPVTFTKSKENSTIFIKK